MIYERFRDGHTVSDDPARFDFDVIHGYLQGAYWCEGIPRDVIERATSNSLSFGLYAPNGRQIGFGRSVTDRATYAYLSDIFVLEQARGRGLGRFLVAAIMEHPDHRQLRHISLATNDAHGLYAKFGFKPLADPSVFMSQIDLQIYRRGSGSRQSDEQPIS